MALFSEGESIRLWVPQDQIKNGLFSKQAVESRRIDQISQTKQRNSMEAGSAYSSGQDRMDLSGLIRCFD